MDATAAPPHLHMVMVPNPGYHPDGDFSLAEGRLALDGASRLTFGNVALYRTSLFQELPRREKLKILPLFRDWIGRGWASGELYTGIWANIGTPDELAPLDRQLHRMRRERVLRLLPRTNRWYPIRCSTSQDSPDSGKSRRNMVR